MKISQMVFPLMVFASFVLLGRWTGEQVEKSVLTSEQKNAEQEELAAITKFDLSWSDEGSNAPALPSNTFSYFPDGKNTSVQQKNILVIGVDNLAKSRPSLEGIWLVLYIKDMPQITLMPIYPSVSGENGSVSFATDERLSGAFRLEKGGAPHPDFLKILENRDLWWTNFVVLDHYSVQALLALSANSNQGRLSEVMHETSADDSTTLPDPEQEPEASLLAQIQTIQSICHTSNLPDSLEQVTGLISNIEGHIKTDISPEQIIQDFKGMLVYGGGFICEFPSLTMTPAAN